MKKFLLSFLSLVCCMAVSAQKTVTFDSSVAGWTSTAAAQTATLDGVTIAVSNGLLASTGEYRIYKSQAFTVTSKAGNIKKIEFTCTKEGTAQYGPGCFAKPEVGNYSYDKAIGTWTGDAAEVKLIASANQVRATQIVVTVSGDAVAPGIEAPEINVDGTNVTISGPEGYGLIYTTDGVDPEDGVGTVITNNTASFTIDASCTIKAIAVDNDDPDNCSEIAVKTVKIYSTMSIAEAHAAKSGDPVEIKRVNVVAVASTGVVLSDETGYMYLYKSNHGLAVGDVINAKAEIGSYGGFKQLPAATEVEKIGVTDVKYPTPVVLDGAALDEWIASPVQQYAQFKGTLNISGNYYNVTVEGAETAIGSVLKPETDLAKKLTSGLEYTFTGYLMYVSSSKYAYMIITDAETDEVAPTIEPISLANFVNGDFESWKDGKASQWNPLTTAGGATVEQSDASHAGTAAVLVKGATSNKRIASTEISVPAGWYTMVAYAKASTETAAVRPGYVVVTLNEAKTEYNSIQAADYKYFDGTENVNLTNTEWTEIKRIFNLDEDAIISIVAMNPKNTGDFLLDDVVLRAATEDEIAATGVTSVAAEAKNAAIVNLAGQKVGKGYKGIVIIGGKKIVR